MAREREQASTNASINVDVSGRLKKRLTNHANATRNRYPRSSQSVRCSLTRVNSKNPKSEAQRTSKSRRSCNTANTFNHTPKSP